MWAVAMWRKHWEGVDIQGRSSGNMPGSGEAKEQGGGGSRQAVVGGWVRDKAGISRLSASGRGGLGCMSRRGLQPGEKTEVGGRDHGGGSRGHQRRGRGQAVVVQGGVGAAWHPSGEAMQHLWGMGRI